MLAAQSLERSTELFAAVVFLIVGLSHIVQPRAWVSFFTHLAERESVGVFIDGFLYFGFGSVIVAFHNVWHGLPTVLTLIGWGLLLKALIRLLFPALGLRVLRSVVPERAWQFRAAGVLAVLLSGFLGFLAFRV